MKETWIRTRRISSSRIRQERIYHPAKSGFRNLDWSSYTRTGHFNNHSHPTCSKILANRTCTTREFTYRIIETQKVTTHFVDNIIFSGASHCHLHGFVYRHNFRIWDLENALKFVAKKTCQSLVWCQCSRRIIGPFSYETRLVSVNVI